MTWDNRCIDSSTRLPSTSHRTSRARSVSSNRSNRKNGRHEHSNRGDRHPVICSGMLPHRINYEHNKQAFFLRSFS